MWYRAYDGDLVNLNHVQRIYVSRWERIGSGESGFHVHAEFPQTIDGQPNYVILEIGASIETVETAMAKISQFLKIESQLCDRPEKKPDRIPVRA